MSHPCLTAAEWLPVTVPPVAGAPGDLLLGSAFPSAAEDCALALLKIGHQRVGFRCLCQRGLSHSPAFESLRFPGSMSGAAPAPDGPRLDFPIRS